MEEKENVKPEEEKKEFDKYAYAQLLCTYGITRNLMFYFAGVTIGIIIASYLRGD